MVRQARLTDFEDIKYIDDRLTIDVNKIHERDYRSDMQRNGFLVQNTFTKENFEKELHEIFLVSEVNNKIVGYLRTDNKIYLEEDRQATVYCPELLESAIQQPIRYLDRIALLPEYRGIKLASRMLKQAEDILKEQGIAYLYSFVVVSPVTNTASIIFHDYNGFQRVDISHPFRFAGFENYQSFKYCKKL